MPFAGTRIIDTHWSAHHAAVVPTAFNATVSIGYPSGTGTYDPETDDTTQDYSTDWEGDARIQALTGQRAVPTGGQILAGIPYLVQLPAGLVSGDVIRVHANCLTHGEYVDFLTIP